MLMNSKGMLSALIHIHCVVFFPRTVHCFVRAENILAEMLERMAHVKKLFGYKRSPIKLKSVVLKPISAKINETTPACYSRIYVCLQDYGVLLLESKESIKEKTKCCFVFSPFKNVVPIPWNSCQQHKGDRAQGECRESKETTTFTL